MKYPVSLNHLLHELILKELISFMLKSLLFKSYLKSLC